MKNISIYISLIFLVFIMFLAFKCKQGNQFQNKFEGLSAHVSKTALVQDWGIPNDEFLIGNRKILVYYKGLIWNKYVFVFNPETDCLILKNLDD